jgi:hypothetical protein
MTFRLRYDGLEVRFLPMGVPEILPNRARLRNSTGSLPSAVAHPASSETNHAITLRPYAPSRLTLVYLKMMGTVGYVW